MNECVDPGSINAYTSISYKKILPVIILGAAAASWWVIANTRAYPCCCGPWDPCLPLVGAELAACPCPLPRPDVVPVPLCLGYCAVGSDNAVPISLL